MHVVFALLIWVLMSICYLYLLWFHKKSTHIHMVVHVTMPGDPGAENAHDTLVNDDLWRKFQILKDGNKTPFNELSMSVQLDSAKLIDPRLHNQIFNGDASVMNREEIVVPEREFFVYTWSEFRRRQLDIDILIRQLKDCFENGEMVCVTGRVMRYINAFSGIVDDELGKTPITRELLFRTALNKAKTYFEEHLNDPSFLKSYNENNESEEFLHKLDLLREDIRKKLESEFDQLKSEDISEIIMAI